MLKLSDIDYDRPDSLIAQHPTSQRGQSRLMVVDRASGEISTGGFEELPSRLGMGDALVLNDTKVLPCRIRAQKEATGAQIELLLLRELKAGLWEALARPGRRARVGAKFSIKGARFSDTVEIVKNLGQIKHVQFQCGDVKRLCSRVGEMPLPPYIKRETESADSQRYQTVYARAEGAAAAPTAGLHFSSEMIQKLRDKGVAVEFVTLHTGLGTFQPLEHEEIEKNRLHAEQYEISPDTARRLNSVRQKSKRVFAVGTTTLRLLETTTGADCEFRAGKGQSDIFIYPGYEFHSADALLTNFHLPRSSLLLLVCAFAGKDLIMRAYETAVKEEFRFYSYGDAMLIL